MLFASEAFAFSSALEIVSQAPRLIVDAAILFHGRSFGFEIDARHDSPCALTKNGYVDQFKSEA